jgi:hypothetical protein
LTQVNVRIKVVIIIVENKDYLENNDRITKAHCSP